MTRIVEWIRDQCSLYAIVQDGVHLPEAYIRALDQISPVDVNRLIAFINFIVQEPYISQHHLRTELPAKGIFAFYQHADLGRNMGYSSSRLFCSYPKGTDAILVVGSGFLKQRDEPVQHNATAMKHARLLELVMNELNERIDIGEIALIHNQLIPVHPDSMLFDI